ncbi:1252_t:CDS:1, partial [Dentiscutata heterogama]
MISWVVNDTEVPALLELEKKLTTIDEILRQYKLCQALEKLKKQ